MLLTLERGQGEESPSERDVDLLPPGTPAGDRARTLGICPDRDSNPRPVGVGPIFQSTEPPQPGLVWDSQTQLLVYNSGLTFYLESYLMKTGKSFYYGTLSSDA